MHLSPLLYDYSQLSAPFTPTLATKPHAMFRTALGFLAPARTSSASTCVPAMITRVSAAVGASSQVRSVASTASHAFSRVQAALRCGLPQNQSRRTLGVNCWKPLNGVYTSRRDISSASVPKTDGEWFSLSHYLANLQDYVLVRMKGKDACKILHNLTTQHINTILYEASQGRASYAAWLTSKGRTMFETIIFTESVPANFVFPDSKTKMNNAYGRQAPTQETLNADCSFLLLIPACSATALIAHIKANTLRAKSKLTLARDLSVWVAAGRVDTSSLEIASDCATANANATGSGDKVTVGESAFGSCHSIPVPVTSEGEGPAQSIEVFRAADGLLDSTISLSPAQGIATPSPTPSSELDGAGHVSPFSKTPAVFADPRNPKLPVCFIIARSDRDLHLSVPYVRVDARVHDVYRTLQGLPRSGREIVAEKSLPLEASLDLLGGINFHKGCYLGQELTARTHFQGLVRKRILPVILRRKEKNPPQPVSDSSTPSNHSSNTPATSTASTNHSQTPAPKSTLFSHPYFRAGPVVDDPKTLLGATIQKRTPVSEQQYEEKEVGKVVSVSEIANVGFAMLRLADLTDPKADLYLTVPPSPKREALFDDMSHDTASAEAAESSQTETETEEDLIHVIPLFPSWLPTDFLPKGGNDNKGGNDGNNSGNR